MQQPVLAPPAPPTPPPGVRIIMGGAESPVAIYQARVAQRKELGDQLERLNDARQDLSNRLADPELAKADKAGIEGRIATMDARIAEVDKQIANADAQVAQAAGVPGAIVEPPPIERNGPPEEVFVLGGLFIVVVLLPISLAYARRIWRRSAAVVSSLPQEVMDRLTRLDQAVDAIAVEVERIGEGQRFMTRVLAEKPVGAAALGAAPEQRSRNAVVEEREPR